MRTMLKSKIHWATVTGTDVNYRSSTAFDASLTAAAGILPYGQVHVVDASSGHYRRRRRTAGCVG